MDVNESERLDAEGLRQENWQLRRDLEASRRESDEAESALADARSELRRVWMMATDVLANPNEALDQIRDATEPYCNHGVSPDVGAGHLFDALCRTADRVQSRPSLRFAQSADLIEAVLAEELDRGRQP